jgi:hypothetical protein
MEREREIEREKERERQREKREEQIEKKEGKRGQTRRFGKSVLFLSLVCLESAFEVMDGRRRRRRRRRLGRRK